MKFRHTLAYSFDDVLLKPQYSDIKSRGQTDLSTKIGSVELQIPIISAPMDTVTEADMAIALGSRGGLGVLHRFAPFDSDITSWVSKCKENDVPVFTSIGINDIETSIGQTYLLLTESKLDGVCIDVAHGDHSLVIQSIKRMRESFPTLNIMAGSIATGESALRLIDAGANILRVGIGGGAVCLTRIVSGHGIPTLQSVIDVANATRNHPDVAIVADGGIRAGGDIVKALAAGAHGVMLGSLLAGTAQTPGESFNENGMLYKIYRGMASESVQLEKRPERKPRIEGVSTKIPFKGNVHDVIKNLCMGIESGLSYSGAKTIKELQERAEFVTISSNGLKENGAHILK